MKLLLSLLLLLSFNVWAIVTVDAGIYEVNAIVVKEGEALLAIFNFRSTSELRVNLSGESAKVLLKDFQSPRSLRIKIQFDKKSVQSTAIATLLSYRALKKNENVPLYVQNNLSAKEEFPVHFK